LKKCDDQSSDLHELMRRWIFNPFTSTMGRETRGVPQAYHTTSRNAALSIYREGRMRHGKVGMFGSGIYFADSNKMAQYKSIHSKGKDAVIIIATVDFGIAVVLEHPDYSMTWQGRVCLNVQSVKGCSNRGYSWEYIVDRSEQVQAMLFSTPSGEWDADSEKLIKRAPHEMTLHNIKAPMAVQMWHNPVQTAVPIVDYFAAQSLAMSIKSGLDNHRMCK
jgi:hypothetical protein